MTVDIYRFPPPPFFFNSLPLNLVDTAQLQAVAPFYTAADQGIDDAWWMTVDMHRFFVVILFLFFNSLPLNLVDTAQL